MFGWFSHPPRRPVFAPMARRPELEQLENRLVPSIGSPFTISGSSLNATRPVTASSANGMSVVASTQKNSNGGKDILAQLYDSSHHQVGNSPGRSLGSVLSFDTSSARRKRRSPNGHLREE